MSLIQIHKRTTEYRDTKKGKMKTSLVENSCSNRTDVYRVMHLVPGNWVPSFVRPGCSASGMSVKGVLLEISLCAQVLLAKPFRRGPMVCLRRKFDRWPPGVTM